jgi:phosphohistidine phosphatase SixA
MRGLFIGLMTLALAGCGSPEDRLLEKMRAGGVTIYMRHAATEPTKDRPPEGKMDFNDCSWQRALTEAGRAQAREIGAALPRLKLPIASVTVSPMCRAMETARLAFGTAAPDPALLVGTSKDGNFDPSAIFALFKRPVPPGAVQVLIGHEHPKLGFQPALKEAEAAVIRKSGDGYEVLGRIPPDQWGKWAK